MSKLLELGFSGPFTANADGSVNGTLNGHPYNIHQSATPDVWTSLQADISSKSVTIVEYLAPPQVIPSLNDNLKKQISLLEATITKRRLREAALTDAGKSWLQAIDTQISDLRAQLTA